MQKEGKCGAFGVSGETRRGSVNTYLLHTVYFSMQPAAEKILFFGNKTQKSDQNSEMFDF